MLCPICRSEMDPAGDSHLDQCGDTRLPAKQYRCPKCPDTMRVVPVPGPWMTNPAALEVSR